MNSLINFAAPRAFSATTLCATVILFIAGCSANDDATSGRLSDVSTSGYENVRAELDFRAGTVSLPMDPYMKEPPQITSRVAGAMGALTSECMLDRGLSAPPASPVIQQPSQMENRRYGIWSVENASRYGFDLPPEVEEDVWASDTTALGVEYNRNVSECDQETRTTLAEQLEFFQRPDIDGKIRDRAESLTLASDEGAAAMAEWRTCTADAGVVLDPASGFPSEHYRRQGKESEIGVAVAYADCGVRTGAAQMLFDIQARYEAAFIDTQQAALTQLSARRDEVLASLEAASAGHPRE